MNIVESKKKKNINDIYNQLGEESRRSLMDFAEFLSQRDGVVAAERTEKLDITRPPEETVVAALKRLNKTYFMLEKKLVFHDASSLMTEHIMQGRAAADVIDELEKLFEKSYQDYLQSFDETD